MQVAVIGLDMAKHVFQMHGVDGSGRAVLPKRLRRGQIPVFSRICRRSAKSLCPRMAIARAHVLPNGYLESYFRRVRFALAYRTERRSDSMR
jgi:hypothetical protein